MPADNYRLAPPLAHRDYIILSDLLSWLRTVLPASQGPILDFGCGDSPYRSLFPNRPYHRADLAGTSGIDYEIRPDETIAAPDCAYGTLLSTQVLEHVDLYREYLNESYRLLAPGGRFFISTHGLFEEHGHPHDFRRWTLTAFTTDLRRAGFEIERADKLTLGPRALLYVMGSQFWKANPSRKSVSGFLLSQLRRFIAQHPARWNAINDRHFGSRRWSADPAGQESFFIGVAAVARKP